MAQRRTTAPRAKRRAPATSPRKRPKQRRAEETVAAILEAAHRILAKAGVDGLTTKRIADVAGVSVGSLYQYFPNKEAVVAALIEERVHGTVGAQAAALEFVRGRSLRESLRHVMRLLRAGSLRRVGSYRELVFQAPTVLQRDLFLERVRKWEAFLADLLEAHRDELRPEALATGPFLLSRAVQGVLHGAALERPELLKDDAFADEVAEMAWRYVARDADAE